MKVPLAHTILIKKFKTQLKSNTTLYHPDSLLKNYDIA